MNGVRSGSATAAHPGAGLPPHPQASERGGGVIRSMQAEHYETGKPPPHKRKSQNSNRSKSAQRKGTSHHVKQEALPSQGLGTAKLGSGLGT